LPELELFQRFISCHCWLLCDCRPLDPLPLGLLRPPSPPLPPPCRRPGPLQSLLLLALHVLFLLEARLDPEVAGLLLAIFSIRFNAAFA
jgi:hypothetical protein